MEETVNDDEPLSSDETPTEAEAEAEAPAEAEAAEKPESTAEAPAAADASSTGERGRATSPAVTRAKRGAAPRGRGQSRLGAPVIELRWTMG